MDDMPKGLKLLYDLRDGKTVHCPKCGKGIVVPVDDYRTTKLFECDECDYFLALD